MIQFMRFQTGYEQKNQPKSTYYIRNKEETLLFILFNPK